MNNKHAYLIIANGNFEQLSFLLQCLDNIRNDFFVLIDKKSKFTKDHQRKLRKSVKKSSLQFLKRIPIYWGDYSLVAAEINLFKASLENNISYDYFHLLSGVDLPLTSADNILAFFDQHPNKIFMTYARMNKQVYDRVKYKYHLLKYTNKSGFSKRKTVPARIIDKSSLLVQKLLHRDYFSKFGVELGYASQWVTVDNKTAKLIINNRKWIEHVFMHSFLCDELFLPTLLNKYPEYKEKVFYKQPVTDDPRELQGNLRYINWWDGSPYTWKDGDESKINQGIRLGHLFSRKFDLHSSPKLQKYIASLSSKQ